MTTPALLVALLLGTAVAPLLAQHATDLDPRTTARIDSVFSRFAVPGSPGCALGVMREGRLVYAKGYGLASIELGVPITPATVFDIGSVSKQFTALAVVLLAQDGKLSLDDEIQKYVPEIPHYNKPVSIRNLLHHTSGLRDYLDLLVWSGVQEESVTGAREALAVLSRQRAANSDAGAEYLYSNSGFFLLSVILERASGQSLRQFAAQRIFAPLGMRHTFYLDDHAEIVPGKASPYAPRGANRFALALANWEQTGDGAVQTSVQDLERWERNFSEPKVGGAAAIRELETPGVLNDGNPISYALGQIVDRYRGLRRVSHGGSWAGFRAQLTRFPEQRTSISALCNLSNALPALLVNRVAEVLLAADFSAPAESPTAAPLPPAQEAVVHPLADYVGRYHSDELLADWEITLAGDSLRLRIGPLLETRFLPTSHGALLAGSPVHFLEANGSIAAITLTSRGARNFRLTRTTQ
ncbi:MAG TPA: serine hydrolase domain-containing protein [Gemmatimonadales bacterium]|jgi:CubicO group peptidase (beta-lactamase class C family)|nr:serine hydrolase domain-containing protein [Gemmatimonadales bacterium]